ncbi:MAG: Hsp20/alpha crystallin family protein [Candidatus Lokiarchaeota archaeon]|nr:Hsp20/alpha crystallin family protein [Candidatus Lokiarchaeota archaeon]
MYQERHHSPKGFASCFQFGPHDIAKMKRMASHFMGGFMRSHIPYNVEDIGDSYLITVPLAGRAKEDVKVSLINKHINIETKKPKIPESESLKDKPEEEKSAQEWCMPFFWKGFTFIDVNMDIPLPVDANADTLTSKMANGLLKITMEKKPAKNINISEN